jgi:2-dehydro-3-deoxyglucarate aldolase
MTTSTPLKDKLRRRELTLGSWITLAHPAIAEIMATAGFDWIVVDLEHSVIDLREAGELIRAIQAARMDPLVRLTSNNPDLAKRVMDFGASGVVVPMVNDRAAAQRAVAAVKYPPAGTRGVGLSRAQGYGTSFDEYAKTINDRSIVIAQVEHIDAIRSLGEIISVPGIDGTIIGPYDLSASMGKPGRYGDDDVKAVLADYERISATAGKTMGSHVVETDPALVLDKVKRGYTFLGFGVDFLFLGDSCRSGMTTLRREIAASGAQAGVSKPGGKG